MKKNKVEVISHAEAYDLGFRLYQKIIQSSFRPDVVVGIARGGYPVACYLCDFLKVKTLVSLQISHYKEGGEKKEEADMGSIFTMDISGKKVLLADDVNDSGNTLKVATAFLRDQNPAELKTAVLHEKTNSEFGVDFYGDQITEWRWIVYPWAVMEDVSKFVKDQNLKDRKLNEIRSALKEHYELGIAEEWLEKVRFYLDHTE